MSYMCLYGGAYPEPTQRLVDEKLDFVFWEGASHLRQVGEHVRHHQVAVKKRQTVAENARERTARCQNAISKHLGLNRSDVLNLSALTLVITMIQPRDGSIKPFFFHLCNIPGTENKSCGSAQTSPDPRNALQSNRFFLQLNNQSLWEASSITSWGLSSYRQRYSQVLHLAESRGRREHIKQPDHLVRRKDQGAERTGPLEEIGNVLVA